MITLHDILGLIGVAVLIAAIYAWTTHRRLPVTFKSFDEMNAVTTILNWARSELAANDPRQKPLAKHELVVGYGHFPPPFMVHMSAENLAILAPYIDRFLDGRGPPRNMPVEYVDWRPAVLQRFKARMQAEGLWPQA